MPLLPQIKTDEQGEYYFFAPEHLIGTDQAVVPNEGELSLDIFESPTELIVHSTIAGVKLSDLEITIHNDMLTIRGERHHDVVKHARPLLRECYWGSFSRSIILPTEVRADEATAILRGGVLTITLPKRNRSTIPIKEIE